MCTIADTTSLHCARFQVRDVGGALCKSVRSANRNDASSNRSPTISATKTSTACVESITTWHDDCVRSLSMRCGFGVRQGARTGVRSAVPVRVCFEERQPRSSLRNLLRQLQPMRTLGAADVNPRCCLEYSNFYRYWWHCRHIFQVCQVCHLRARSVLYTSTVVLAAS